MRRPDFVIAGVQKAGTTWLEHHLNRHPRVATPRRQLHFFDRHYDRGLEWYAAQFARLGDVPVCGEKTTEYFDPATAADVFPRLAADCPETRVFILLRDPVKRAMSALEHTVASGVEPIPDDPGTTIFEDRRRAPERAQRYIERGFYARLLDEAWRHLPRERVCVMVFEEDVVADPRTGWRRACAFLGVDPLPLEGLDAPVNALRLSRPAIVASRLLYRVPYARGLIRRVDGVLGTRPWRADFRDETRAALQELYRPENEDLFRMLGRRIPAWEDAGA